MFEPVKKRSSSAMNHYSFLGILFFGIAGLLLIFTFVSLGSRGETYNSYSFPENVPPAVSNIKITTTSYNGVHESIMYLTEATTTDYYMNALITDENGCEHIVDMPNTPFSSAVSMGMYRYDGQDPYEENNNYYSTFLGDTPACSYGTQDLGDENACTPGGDDIDVSVECIFKIHHFAEATVTGSLYAYDFWEAYVYIESEAWLYPVEQGDLPLVEEGDPVLVPINPFGQAIYEQIYFEVGILTALDVESSISYGSIALSATSSDVSFSVRNTGNEPIDLNISGTDMPCSQIGTIPTVNQKYATGTVTYASKVALSSTPDFFDFNLNAQSSSSTPSSGTLYWQVQVPATGVIGTCAGTSTLSAVHSS